MIRFISLLKIKYIKIYFHYCDDVLYAFFQRERERERVIERKISINSSLYIRFSYSCDSCKSPELNGYKKITAILKP